VSEATKDEFTARCKLLENIVNCWETGKSVCQTCAFIAEVSSKDQSTISNADCESDDMMLASGSGMDQTSTSTITGMDHVPTSVAEMNQVPASVAEMNQVPASVSEMNQVPASVVEVNQIPNRVSELNQVPTSVAMVSQPLYL